MKKLVMGIVATAMVASLMVFADPAMNKKHAGKKGVDNAKVNCAYCHKTAGIEKKKGLDMAKLLKSKYCAIDGCHKK